MKGYDYLYSFNLFFGFPIPFFPKLAPFPPLHNFPTFPYFHLTTTSVPYVQTEAKYSIFCSSAYPYHMCFRASDVPYVKLWYGTGMVRYGTVRYGIGILQNAAKRRYGGITMIGAMRRVNKRCDYCKDYIPWNAAERRYGGTTMLGSKRRVTAEKRTLTTTALAPSPI